MKVKTAIIVDNLGTFGESPDEERDEILKDLNEQYEIDAELVFYGHLFSELPTEKQVDLAIVDYGALWQADMSNESKLVVKWAQDHPGSLVVLWSDMTADAIISDVLSPFDDTSGWYKDPDWPHNLRPLYEPRSERTAAKKHDDEKCLTTVGTHVNTNEYMDCPCKCHKPYGEIESWLDQSYNLLRTWFKDD